MRNPVTIPLTKDKTRNLIIDLDNVSAIIDNPNIDTDEGSEIYFTANGFSDSILSELSATDLYKEICSPSK